jgi:UDP-2,3-diacylglucosamine pyrophosphatase LpxH
MKHLQSAVIGDMVMRENIKLVLGHFHEKASHKLSITYEGVQSS